MRKNKKIKSSKQSNEKRLLESTFKLKTSEYSKQYRKYMISEYSAAEMMVKKIIQLPCCRQYYLRFPLEGLIKGVVKKMMLNSYEVTVFGFFLQQIQEWTIGRDLFLALVQQFPDILHINQPTDTEQLKQISMFLYFSSYSVKQFLSGDIEMYRKQMQKIFPEFQKLHTHWVNNQSTVNFAISPRALNQFYKKVNRIGSLLDYNICVDKILQISPCYDLSNREEKKKLPDFGYMEPEQNSGNKNINGFMQFGNQRENPLYGNFYYGGQEENREDCSGKIQEIPGIDLMDLKYDGEEI